MSERRHCDRRGCQESEPIPGYGHPDFLSVSDNRESSALVYHFCSWWCLATWAVGFVSPREMSEKGAIDGRAPVTPTTICTR